MKLVNSCKKFQVLIVLIGMLVTNGVSAALIYENARLEPDTSGHGNIKSQTFRGSDAFSLGQSAFVSSIELDLSQLSTTIVNLSLNLFIGTQSFGNSLFEQSYDGGQISSFTQSASLNIYTLTVDGLSLDFASGQDYWLSFFVTDNSGNDSGLVTPSDVISIDGDGSHLECRGDSCTNQRTNNYDIVFRLYGAETESKPVPEPSALLLMAVGMLCAGLLRRRRH